MASNIFKNYRKIRFEEKSLLETFYNMYVVFLFINSEFIQIAEKKTLGLFERESPQGFSNDNFASV